MYSITNESILSGKKDEINKYNENGYMIMKRSCGFWIDFWESDTYTEAVHTLKYIMEDYPKSSFYIREVTDEEVRHNASIKAGRM